MAVRSRLGFSLKDFHAVPEAGYFDGDIIVKNFEAPEIDVELNSDFFLDFLARFLELNDLRDLSGQVLLKMKFHDIIDLANPQNAIEKLNEAYYSQLIVNNLSFKPEGLPDIKKVNAKVTMDGHKADIDYIDIAIGKSDIHIDGSVSDLPAILHHTDDPVDCRMNISSKYIDISEFTGDPSAPDSSAARKGFDEQIANMRMKLDFKSSAKAFTESKHLPIGEFFIDDFYAKLTHYPHTFHDFHADVFVEEDDFRIIDFSGMIDKSDFHFHGKLHDYAFWFKDSLKGDTRIEYDLTSDHMRLEDLFSYKGENYVPEDYRHEELSELKIHGIADLHFRNDFHSADLRLTQWDAKMKIHPLKFRNFKGRIHYEDEHIQIDTLFGQVGRTAFTMDLNYYLGEDEAIRKRDNHLGFHASRLDMDELMNYNPGPPSAGSEAAPVDHEAGFNIYDLPFTPMTFDVDIRDLNYHKYLIKNFVTKLRTERDHHIRIDRLELDAAGGHWDIVGSFDGRDRNKIFLDPTIKITNVNLDKLLFKFDNFGQDHLVSENLHGDLSGTITGHIHVHPDLVPKLDDSEIHLDVEVLNGRLENYGPIMAMAEFFGDKNLAAVRFDSLRNQIDIKGGYINIPNMTLNTTLGHMDFSGSQKMGGSMDMEYYIRVPLKMVTGIAKQKLFGKKNKKEAEDAADAASEEDEIVYKDNNKKTRYLSINIKGDMDNYKFGLGKDKRNKKKRKRRKKGQEDADVSATGL
ncbi:MAG: AsmA-like C-terminal region-containing protein [Bacteroidota bacterium]